PGHAGTERNHLRIDQPSKRFGARPSSDGIGMGVKLHGGVVGNAKRNAMPKLIVTLAAAAAILLSGSLTWKAEADPGRGALSTRAAVQNFTPVEKAACQGWGPYCGPGFVRRCGPYRCWCRPCY